MKKQLIYISFIYFFIQANLAAQSFWFGPKAGGTICIQSWNGSDRQPLLGGNVALFIETTDPEKTSGSLYAQLGLHQRGSSSRTFFNSFNNFQVPSLRYVFNNLSLQVGAKKFYKSNFYYLVGIRAEYTLWTNFDSVNEQFNFVTNPQNEYLRRLTGGITGGGGYQMEIGDLYGAAIEFSIHPDFFRNYYQPAIGNVVSPFTGQIINLGEVEIRNTSVELTLVFRFLRKVEYY